VFRKIRTLISGGLHALVRTGAFSVKAGPAPVPCRKYEARLEDYLQGTDDFELHEHLSQCAHCRSALENSRVGAQLLRDAWEPAREPQSAFLAGVMARIQEEKMRAESPAAFWNPLEFLASRVSLTAATVLFALSVYMVGFAPRRAPTSPVSAGTELSAADLPQPPGDPDSNEEVLQSLMERNYGH
jgi:predicted anti-sigma-YlaC factor YlaD